MNTVRHTASSLAFITAAVTSYTYQSVEAQRGAIRNAFGRYLAPAVVEELIANPERLELGGEERDLTLMFCDVRDFTAISEDLTPSQLTRFINELLSPLSEIILAQRGTIDKYMGDAIMAFWNAPLDDGDHATNACGAALRMIDKMEELNAEWKERARVASSTFRTVNIGIGINTGRCCVGNLGSSVRFDYSAIGDDVNVASRFEGLTKIYGVSNVIGEHTLALAKPFAALELDMVQVKGRTRATRIYTLIRPLQVGNVELASVMEKHHDFLSTYRQQQWDDADRLLTECLSMGIPTLATCYQTFRSRIAMLRKSAFRLIPGAEAIGTGSVDSNRSPAAGYGVSVVSLQHVSAPTVMKLLDSFATKPGMIRADPPRNMILVQGNGPDRSAAIDTVITFDQDWMRGQSVGIYPIRNSTPEPIIAELEKILDSGESGLNQNMVKFQPIGRQNAILVVTRKADLLRRASTWIERLDTSNAASMGVRVYRLRYGEAKQIAGLLNELFVGRSGESFDSPTNHLSPGSGATTFSSGGAADVGTQLSSTFSGRQQIAAAAGSTSPSSTAGPPLGGPAGAGGTSPMLNSRSGMGSGSASGAVGSGGNGTLLPGVRVTADVNNNSLLIYANQESYRIIEQTLRQLDRPQLQVAINATIAEVVLNNSLNYGVQVFLQSSDAGLGRDKGSIDLTNLATNAVLARTLPGFNFLAGSEATPRVILSALQSVTDVKVLSSPSLVVLDNHAATLQVGDQIPVATRTAQSVEVATAPVVNNIDYRNTGIILRVAPRVNSNGNVLLDIEQEISNVASTNSGTLTPTVSQRRVKSSISVANGQTVVLGGLISERQERGKSGLPLLDKIGPLGEILGSNAAAGFRDRRRCVLHWLWVARPLRYHFSFVFVVAAHQQPPSLPNDKAREEGAALGLHSLDDYAPLIGAAAIERILKKAERLRTLHAVHISSTFYGGGVTEILTPLTLMMNALGIETGWRLVQGTPEFFTCTKKLHNTLQGDTVDFTDEEKATYEQVTFENALRLHIDDCDAVIVHDPQPLPLVIHLKEADTPWIWQCHVDLSSPNPAAWNYLRRFVEQYDMAIFSLPEYAKDLAIRQRFITPAINPFAAKNRELSDDEIEDCLAHYRIPTDRPLVVQISRFDPWKDPAGVIEAFRIAREQVDCTLVLLGSAALDDPEAGVILETIQSSVDERVIVLTVEDAILVNALQRRAAVVLQKSIREGFGLTVTEAMWKGAAVVGGNVGGIRRQIKDGENGFLVDSVEQTAERIIELLKDVQLRERLGSQARETVRENFLMSHLLEDWIDLLAAFDQASKR